MSARSAASLPLPVICLGGPTGSGKTGLALKLAQKFGCEVINADSRQVYADFPIITAQPNASERSLVPHHLYGFLNPDSKISAGAWAAMAARAASEILARGKMPLIVGGTGLYFRALLEGLASIPPVPQAISQECAARMRALGPETMHQQLRRVDPEYAARVHPRDQQRIQRALEVWAATGRPFSWWHIHSKPAPLCAGPLIILNVELRVLEPFLISRIKTMLQSGALEEARAAWAKCPRKDAPAWTGIGCGELLAAIEGRIGPGECEDLWRASTRAYAKRQITWFKAQRDAVFIAPGDLSAIENSISAFFAANGRLYP